MSCLVKLVANFGVAVLVVTSGHGDTAHGGLCSPLVPQQGLVRTTDHT